MAGATVSVDVREVTSALAAMRAAGRNLRPLMLEIGEEEVQSTRARFRSQTGPDGAAWAPLSPTYLASQRKQRSRGPDRILTLRGQLGGTLRYLADASSVRWGTDRIYGAAMQFGAARGSFGATRFGVPIPWGNIPARPYLGISGQDRLTILDMVGDYLDRSIRGS